MLTAMIPFRYGKGSEHWNFMPGDSIGDEIIAPADLGKMIDKEQVKVNISKDEINSVQNNERNKIKNARVSFDYLDVSVVKAKELISSENDTANLLNAKNIEEKQSNPRKTITEAIKRRIYDITGKRIP